MKKLQRLTKKQKELLRNNNYNDLQYLAERDLPEGIMFVDRNLNHRLFYDRGEKVFTRLEVKKSNFKEEELNERL